MKKYNRSEIMRRAWRLYRRYPNLSWKCCMINSWDMEKNLIEDISPVMFNKIMSGLRSFNKSISEKKPYPMLFGTAEHYNFLNSKLGRKIIKLPEENETKIMLQSGELFLNDIINQRRKESRFFKSEHKKIIKKRRNRIVNLETCAPINIQEYVRDNS